MRRGLLALGLLVILLAASLPAPTAEADTHRRCFEVPEVHKTYEWAYEDEEGVELFHEVIRSQLATTQHGNWNMTTTGFMERQDGERRSWGRMITFEQEAPFPGGRVSKDTWTEAEGTQARRIDNWDPPLQLVHLGTRTCPGAFEEVETSHSWVTGAQPTQYVRNETWQMRAGAWTNLTVPAGTFEVLPVRAIRVQDCARIVSYYSPEVKAFVKRETYAGLEHRATVQCPSASELAKTRSLELTWYLLDQRPTANFRITPTHPAAGDTVVLDGTPSHDPEGPIVHYRWIINGEERTGANVTLVDVEEGTLQVRLFVTDQAQRTSTVGSSLYVPPEDGSGIAIDGPLAASEDQFVRLDALTPFEPIRVRWFVGDELVGDGSAYQFRMAETVNVTAEALHPNGRAYLANHTVELLEAPADGDGASQDPNSTQPGQRRQSPSAWPSGGSEVLSLLAPLEGQVIRGTTTAHIWTSGPTELRVDGEPVWSGDGPEAQVELDLEPGRHKLQLTSGQRSHVVNVTVSQPSQNQADPASNGSGADGQARTPGLGPLALLVIGLAASRFRRRA